MMVPESDVGVDKPFSFAQDHNGFQQNGLGEYVESLYARC
jgi:hypothetical protein